MASKRRIWFASDDRGAMHRLVSPVGETADRRMAFDAAHVGGLSRRAGAILSDGGNAAVVHSDPTDTIQSRSGVNDATALEDDIIRTGVRELHRCFRQCKK